MDKQTLKEILEQHKLWLSSTGEKGKQAYLREADLQGAYLQGADLHRADLQGANLSWAYLRGADFRGSDLREANLHKANLGGAILYGTNLSGVYLHEANLGGADLREADLHGADLQGADLHGADLQGADLQGADLQEADLQGAVYDLKQLKQARNAPKQYLTAVATPKTADALYKKQIDAAKKEIRKLEQTKRNLEREKEQLSTQADQDDTKNKELEDELNKVKTALKVEQQAKQQGQERQSRLDEMKAGIQAILNAIESDKEIINCYKIQSFLLLGLGLSCCAIATIYLVYLWFHILPNIAENGYLHFVPAAILVLIGTGLLRHDWKIRQLILKLIEQNNQTDIAMGILEASLGLSNIGTEAEKSEDGLPTLVKETFAEVRQALLRGEVNNDTIGTQTDPNQLQQILEQLQKIVPK